jgi:hypothetical protein
VIHLDLKTHNIMLVGAGGSPRVVVTDFGLSWSEEADVSVTVEAGGTPAYMAPEQVSRRAAITPAADIYALGVVLFEMVTGRLPFVGETAMATAVRRLDEDPPSPRSLVPAVPAVWDAVILRCLRREPGERFATAGEVVAALDGVEPRWLRRRRRRRLAAYAGVVVAAGAVTAGTWRVVGGATGGCPPLARDARDLYVDASAAPGGTGVARCPLRTVTAALAAAGDDGDKTIHVAAGTYDAAGGERFPLVVRGGLTVVGAGPDVTRLVGTGPAGLAGRGGIWPYLENSQFTVVVGDPRRHTTIADLTVHAGTPAPLADRDGIACIDGNADSFDAPAPPANTHLHNVAIENVGTGIVAGQAGTAPRGCNLEMTTSTIFHAKTGIWQLGCGLGDVRAPTALTVRDSRFAEIGNTPGGAAIRVWDCAVRVDIRDSQVSHSDVAISLIRHDDAPPPHEVILERNRFADLVDVGILLSQSAVVDRLDDNEFTVIGGAALRIDRGRDGDVVTIRRARGNRFHGNARAIELRGPGRLLAGTLLDFGTPDDPGRNRLRCNAVDPGAARAGYDLRVALPVDPGARLWFAGNSWDHVPPTILAADDAPNGTDIAGVTRDQIDVSGADGGSSCEGFVAGP